MRVIVVDHHSNGGTRRIFEGSPDEVRRDLLFAYPWLHQKVPGGTVEQLVLKLDATQAHTAVVDTGDILLFKTSPDHNDVIADMMGHDPKLEAAIDAAAFLSGMPRPESMAVRSALLNHDESIEAAALVACGLSPTPANLEALRGLLGAVLTKAEPNQAELPQQVLSVTDDGQAFAAEVHRAIKAGEVVPVQLGGKHSAGALLASDPKKHGRILLKPGSGPQNPAAGASESGSSQSKREAAFWSVVSKLGLGDWYPETHLLLLDGKEYAALRLVPASFKNLNKLRNDDPVLPRRLFHLFLADGTLHKWATIDYILGNPDRNAGNIMARGDEVKLIDHGSALAGSTFAPGTDKNSFIPYYLRALAASDFDQLAPAQKVAALPRLSAAAEPAFKTWLNSLTPELIAAELVRYGIDPAPTLARLEGLKYSAQHVPADLAVLQAWVL